jgi:phage portal protein BeeE
MEGHGKDRIARYFDGPLRELFMISGFSSDSSDSSADSPLQAAAMECQQQLKGKIHNVQMLNNGGRMSLLIIFKDAGGISDDEMRARLQILNERFAGSENAGRIGAMEGSEIEEVREMGVSQKDMDFVNMNETASRAIYSRYKIPLPLITTDASSFNNMETGVSMLYDFAVLPLAEKSFSGLSRFLLPRFGYKLTDVRITYNPDSIGTLKSRRLDELIKRKNIGVETVNELREAIPNRENLEGGDVLYQPATLIPLGTDIHDTGDLQQQAPNDDPD